MVKTETIGEARGLMDVMDNCDGVVVAGGDGALSEAVTGLLRRNDSAAAAQRFPIGIIPIGKTNSVAKSLFKEFKGTAHKEIRQINSDLGQLKLFYLLQMIESN